MAIPYSPIELDLCITRGDTRPFTIALTEEQADGTEEPLDLTGSSLLLTVDPSATPTNDTANVFQLTATLAGDPTTGIATFQVQSADWVGVAAGSYFYDVELTDSAGDILTILKGVFLIPQDITK